MSEKPYIPAEQLATPELVALKRQVHMLMSDYDLQNVHYKQDPLNDGFIITASRVEDTNFFTDLNVLCLDFQSSLNIDVHNSPNLVISIRTTLPIQRPTLH
jgi:hypothetical protein